MQRNAVILGLDNAKDDDIIALSDIDEFARSEVYESIRQNAEHLKFSYQERRVATCLVDNYYYNLHTINQNKWAGTRFALAQTVRKLSPDTVRESKPMFYIDNAGWHFSYFGGVKRVKNKIQSIAEGAWLDRPEYTDESAIARRIAEGVDLYERPYEKWNRRSEIDPDVPSGVRIYCERYQNEEIPDVSI